jgi:hypothetical protein
MRLSLASAILFCAAATKFGSHQNIPSTPTIGPPFTPFQEGKLYLDRALYRPILRDARANSTNCEMFDLSARALRFTQTGLGLIRNPVDLENSSQIDSQMTRELLGALEQPPRLKLFSSGVPTFSPLPIGPDSDIQS